MGPFSLSRRLGFPHFAAARMGKRSRKKKIQEEDRRNVEVNDDENAIEMEVDDDEELLRLLMYDDELKEEESRDPETLIVNLEQHAHCEACQYKLNEAIQSFPGIVSVETEDDIVAVGVSEVNPLELQQHIEEKTNKKVKVYQKEKSCDKEEVVEKFNVDEFLGFCASFISEAGKSAKGKWGEIYSSAYGAIVKVTCSDVEGTESFGTAFVIFKSKDLAILMTCAHTFKDMDLSLITVTTCEFKPFKATILHLSTNLDFCMLQVKDDLGPHVTHMKLWCGSVSFGQKFFSISVPHHQMRVEENTPVYSHLFNSLWFSFSKGYIAHPFLVGVHGRNMGGRYLQLQSGGFDNGSSGAPIIDIMGRVIGVFVASSTNADGCIINHFGLRLNSIKEDLNKVFELEEKQMSLLQIIKTHLVDGGKRKRRRSKKKRAKQLSEERAKQLSEESN